MNTTEQPDSVEPMQSQKKNDVSSIIYHIADPNHWEQAQVSRIYSHPSLHTEGFIHCSSRHQLEETANLYFSDEEEILVLFIDSSKL